jgi:membrane-associated phospholipid phosphatase
VRTSEWLTVGFLGFLLAIALARSAPRDRVIRLVVLACACALPIITFARFHDSRVAQMARDWLPGLYLLLGYWAAGQVYRHVPGVEQWLSDTDARVFAHAARAIIGAPRAVLELIELAYLLYYPLVPAGLVTLYLAGHRAQADAYWTAVLLAAFASCAALPFAGTRPPRALGCETWIDRRRVTVRRLNWAVLAQGSIQVNTFPSAHAATSAAVAVFLVPLGWISAPFALVAAGIGIGAFVGRYHYAMDVVFGVAIGVVAGIVAGL